MYRSIWPLVLLFLFCFCLSTCYAGPLERREWTVEGVVREALIYVPPKAMTDPTPIIFAFHDYKETMNSAATNYAYHLHWPEAIAVYMQGSPHNPESIPNVWQTSLGDKNDHDLKFFDNVLNSLTKDYRVDEKRIYATGNLNGGSFTYVLWAARGDRFAAFAPSAASNASTIALVERFKPKPILHAAGKSDNVVKLHRQLQSLNLLLDLNKCDFNGTDWGNWCTRHDSKIGAPIIVCVHPGTHRFPPEVAPIIVKFFKEHSLP